jgi:hypothetical protein
MPLAPTPPIVQQNEIVQQTINLISLWKIMIRTMETATQLRRICVKRWLEFSTTSVLFAWYYIPLHNQKEIWLTSISVCRLYLPLTFDVGSHINQWRGNNISSGYMFTRCWWMSHQHLRRVSVWHIDTWWDCHDSERIIIHHIDLNSDRQAHNLKVAPMTVWIRPGESKQDLGSEVRAGIKPIPKLNRVRIP